MARADDHPSFRSHAVWTGVLFIIATAFLFLGEALYKPILGSADALAQAGPNSGAVTLGLLVEFACILSIALIPVAMFPVLKLHSEVLALAYVVLRLLEAALFAIGDVGKFFLIDLSKAYLAVPDADPQALEIFATVLMAGSPLAGAIGTIYNVTFMVGALVFYSVLYRTGLIPRWISAWGVVSVAVLGILAVSVAFVDIPDAIALPLIVPLALQEMVMAVWLIARGFDQDAVARLG